MSTEPRSPPTEEALPALNRFVGAGPATRPPLRSRTGSAATRWSGAWRFLAMAVIGAVPIAALIWWQTRGLPRDRVAPLLIGTFLFVTAVFFAILHLSRSGRAYDVARGLVHKTTEDLAVAYAALAGANEALRETGAARDRALTDLEAAARQQEVLLASLSHDLMNPLTVISGQAQLLQQRAETLATPGLTWLIDGLVSIETTSTKMGELITELRDLAQLQSGHPLPLNPEPTDLVALARETVTAYAETTDRHRFRLDLGPPTVVGQWDGMRLRRVVANLLANAVKYSPAGGEIAVCVRREADANDAIGLIVIRDEGLGILAADLPYVFERFHRGGNVVDRLPGTGLGLAGARQIDEGHGGTIALESEEGIGTAVTVRLPLCGSEGEGLSGRLGDKSPISVHL